MKTILHLILTSDIGRLLQQITNNHNTAAIIPHLQLIPAYRTTSPADKVISNSYSKK
jgi:hypothetical protein